MATIFLRVIASATLIPKTCNCIEEDEVDHEQYLYDEEFPITIRIIESIIWIILLFCFINESIKFLFDIMLAQICIKQICSVWNDIGCLNLNYTSIYFLFLYALVLLYQGFLFIEIFFCHANKN